MKVTGHEVTGVILSPVTFSFFFVYVWMVRSRRFRRLRRRGLPLRRYRRRRTTRLYRRRRTRSRVPRQTRVVTRTFTILSNVQTTVAYNTNQGTGGTLAIKLSDFADGLAFAPGFDQFRINWAKFSFVPQADRNTLYQIEGAAAGTSVASMGVPAWGAYIDWDDVDTAPTSINNIIQNRGKWAPWPRSVHVSWKPKPLQMLYKSGTATGYALLQRPTWIDVVDSGTPHYGLKWYFAYPHSTNIAKTGTMILPYYSKTTISVSFKNPLPAASNGNI